MPAITSIIAAAALAVGTASYVSSQQQRKEAQNNFNQSAEQQAQARSEQQALNKQKQIEERRQQIRESRVRQGRLSQAAENTGVSESSGELGASSNLATQLGANIGSNVGAVAAGGRISQLTQNAVDFNNQAQGHLNEAASAQNLFGLSQNIFSAAGGFKTLDTSFTKFISSTL